MKVQTSFLYEWKYILGLLSGLIFVYFKKGLLAANDNNTLKFCVNGYYGTFQSVLSHSFLRNFCHFCCLNLIIQNVFRTRLLFTVNFLIAINPAKLTRSFQDNFYNNTVQNIIVLKILRLVGT